ncbi:MAG: hypothetical protein HPY76_04000 [Anaerolineae bacterium]|nr:hypothetical protein [Anaerolineae bacterium]
MTCFFVDAGYRGRGLPAGLLRVTVDDAVSQGVPAVEAYPLPQGSAS